MKNGKAKIFAAIDTSDFDKAQDLVKQISPYFSGIKLGLEFFMRFGAKGITELMQNAAPDTKLFLDLKFHDIPNTVAKAIENILDVKADFITIHAAGGHEMVTRAVKAVEGTETKILAVTVLTSLSDEDLRALTDKQLSQTVLALAKSAQGAGAHGLVCSAHEINILRNELGSDITLIVPGIRPLGAQAQDQKRVMTPVDAFSAGADYLVIGRPVTLADNPEQAACEIRNSVSPETKVA